MTAADLSIFHPDRAGENGDERTYHDVTCSLAEFDDSNDDHRLWWVRCRDAHADEEIIVEQDRHTLKLRAYESPARFHRAALSFVRAEPECQDGDP